MRRGSNSAESLNGAASDKESESTGKMRADEMNSYQDQKPYELDLSSIEVILNKSEPPSPWPWPAKVKKVSSEKSSCKC